VTRKKVAATTSKNASSLVATKAGAEIRRISARSFSLTRAAVRAASGYQRSTNDALSQRRLPIEILTTSPNNFAICRRAFITLA
jgi:hypothetical protein